MIIITLIFLALHLTTAFFNYAGFWGFDTWSYYPVFLPVILFLLGTAALNNNLSLKIAEKFGKIGTSISKFPFWLLAVVTGTLLFFFSQATYFLGDGYLRISDANRGVFFSGAEPLDTFIHNVFHSVANLFLFDDSSLGFTGEVTYRIISILCGVALLFSLRKYGRKLFPDNSSGNAWIMGLLIFTAGFSQIFFGYVESYTILTYTIILFILSSLSMLKNREYSLLPSLFFSVSFLLHPASALLLPPMLYSYSRVIEDRKVVQYSKPLIIPVVFTLLLLGLFSLGGFNPGKIIQAFTEKSRILTLFGDSEYYGILSAEHLLDILNQIILVFPAVIGLPLLFKKILPEDNYYRTFLVITFAFLFIPVLLLKPELGFARDWDLFSLFSIPLTILIAFQLIHSKENRLQKAFIIIAICLLHTAPWIGVNSTETMSVARAERIAGTEYWPGYARSLIYNDLSSYYYKKKNIDKAYQLIYQSYKNENNPRFLYTLANLSEKTGRFAEATEFYKILTKEDNFKFDALSKLVTLYLGQEKYAEAEKALTEILLIDNKDPKFHFMLGVTSIKLNKYENALRAFSNARGFDSGTSMAIAGLAENANTNRNYGEAEMYYRILLELEPKDPTLNFNLATVYFYSKQYQLAEQYIVEAEKLGFDSTLIRSLRKDIMKDTINKIK